MPATRLIGRALLAAALTGAGLALPARAADETAPGDRPAEPRRPEGDRQRGERPGRPDGDRPDRPADQQRLDPGAVIERAKADILSMDLSAEQKSQVEAIFAKGKEELAAYRQQSEGKDPGERTEGARAILQAVREKVGGVLNDEQRQALRRR